MALLIISFIRTIVPGIVGAVLGFFTTLNLAVDPQFEGALTAVLSMLFMAIYYLIVRVIEERFPMIGILLGYAKSPDSYSKGPGVELTQKPNGNPEITVTIDNPRVENAHVAVITPPEDEGPKHSL